MTDTPTMQNLGFCARDNLSAAGSTCRDRLPASFDVIMDVYEREGDGPDTQIEASACEEVANLLDAEPETAQPAVEPFVREALEYLRAQYPAPEEVREDRLILSRLFQAHLAEAQRVE